MYVRARMVLVQRARKKVFKICDFLAYAFESYERLSNTIISHMPKAHHNEGEIFIILWPIQHISPFFEEATERDFLCKMEFLLLFWCFICFEAFLNDSFIASIVNSNNLFVPMNIMCRNILFWCKRSMLILLFTKIERQERASEPNAFSYH